MYFPRVADFFRWVEEGVGSLNLDREPGTPIRISTPTLEPGKTANSVQETLLTHIDLTI